MTLNVREYRLLSAVQRIEDSVGLCLLERSDRGEHTRVVKKKPKLNLNFNNSY